MVLNSYFLAAEENETLYVILSEKQGHRDYYYSTISYQACSGKKKAKHMEGGKECIQALVMHCNGSYKMSEEAQH